MLNLTYRLLDNSTAVLLTRQPSITKEALKISILNAPDNSTAIIECPGNAAYYLNINDGCCSVPVSSLNGIVKVVVAILDDSVPLKKWICDELKVDRLEDGSVLVCPNDLNLPQTIADLRLDNQALHEENEANKSKISALELRINKMIEAYNFI